MARSSLLLDLVRAGARGDQALFRKALEALVTEERAKQHHVLADRLAAHLHTEGARGSGPVAPPTRRDGTTTNLYHEITTERRLNDLVLPDSVAHAGRELVEEHRRAELLAAYNLQPRHRVLLTGPPGNGKTSFAEAIATELAVPLVSVRYESVIASYLGETAVRLSRLFDQVRMRRCVLFFDEFDVVGKERGDLHETGEIKRVVSSLLLQIDTLPSSVVAISATNHPELLDRAVWRRFTAISRPAKRRCRGPCTSARSSVRTGETGETTTSRFRKMRSSSIWSIERFADCSRTKAKEPRQPRASPSSTCRSGSGIVHSIRPSAPSPACWIGSHGITRCCSWSVQAITRSGSNCRFKHVIWSRCPPPRYNEMSSAR